MKNTVFAISIITLLTIKLTSCTTHPPQPVQKTAAPALIQYLPEPRQKGYIEFVEDYKFEASSRIAVHRDSLFEYRHHHALPVIRPKEANKALNKLDLECSHLQADIDHYHPENVSEWQTFHSRFDDKLRRLDAAMIHFTSNYYK